jgi:two-component system, NarL family, captular synthesis response regulator RcsB
MIRKVLIAEDQESANISVQKTLEELGVKAVDYVYYCDDALLRIENEKWAGRSYDLLICDLYFEEDYRAQKISEGSALISASRQIQPELKILVFSAESRPAVIDSLFHNLGIDGYVRKARNDVKELRTAFEKILKNQQHYPKHIADLAKHQNSYDFTDFDVTIISLLADGVPQKDIPDYLQQHKITPSSLSAVEKHLSKIKGVLEFSKNEQLVAFCKDMGII